MQNVMLFIVFVMVFGSKDSTEDYSIYEILQEEETPKIYNQEIPINEIINEFSAIKTNNSQYQRKSSRKNSTSIGKKVRFQEEVISNESTNLINKENNFTKKDNEISSEEDSTIDTEGFKSLLKEQVLWESPNQDPISSVSNNSQKSSFDNLSDENLFEPNCGQNELKDNCISSQLNEISFLENQFHEEYTNLSSNLQNELHSNDKKIDDLQKDLHTKTEENEILKQKIKFLEERHANDKNQIWDIKSKNTKAEYNLCEEMKTENENLKFQHQNLLQMLGGLWTYSRKLENQKLDLMSQLRIAEENSHNNLHEIATRSLQEDLKISKVLNNAETIHPQNNLKLSKMNNLDKIQNYESQQIRVEFLEKQNAELEQKMLNFLEKNKKLQAIVNFLESMTPNEKSKEDVQNRLNHQKQELKKNFKAKEIWLNTKHEQENKKLIENHENDILNLKSEFFTKEKKYMSESTEREINLEKKITEYQQKLHEFKKHFEAKEIWFQTKHEQEKQTLIENHEKDILNLKSEFSTTEKNFMSKSIERETNLEKKMTEYQQKLHEFKNKKLTKLENLEKLKNSYQTKWEKNELNWQNAMSMKRNELIEKIQLLELKNLNAAQVVVKATADIFIQTDPINVPENEHEYFDTLAEKTLSNSTAAAAKTQPKEDLYLNFEVLNFNLDRYIENEELKYEDDKNISFWKKYKI